MSEGLISPPGGQWVQIDLVSLALTVVSHREAARESDPAGGGGGGGTRLSGWKWLDGA